MMDGPNVCNAIDIKVEPLDANFYEERLERAREVLNREFTKEVEEREAQVVLIQERLQAAQKCLRVLKYVATCDYYDLKEDLKRDDIPISEPAIHPAVKKLLIHPKCHAETPEPLHSSRDTEDSPHATPVQVKDDIVPTTVPNEINRVSVVPKTNVTLVRGTYRLSQQLIVGNVSKAIHPAEREGDATHKWMMYLRLKDTDHQLQTIIKKVRYFLHDSYKPDDVIDVTTPPFHLTRRGWGEFPVRVTLYFHHPSNKPIDIIHNLKLDYTYSGTQMLGGETVVELNLFHDDIEDFVDDVIATKKSPEKSLIEKIIAVEHDYCSVGGCEDVSKKKSLVQNNIGNHQVVESEGTSEVSIIKTWTDKNGRLEDWYNKNLLNRASNLYFFSTEACVKWLLNRWPIVTPHSSVENYRILHPYTFSSYDDFYRANIGRKRASEWHRAWKIKTVLEDLRLCPWTTKQIMMYSRMYGYVHFIGKQYDFPPSSIYKDISTYSDTIDTTSNLRQLEAAVEEEIDILGDDKPSKNSNFVVKKCKSVMIVSGFVKFVDVTSREIGIRLLDEELVEGVTINAPSAILASALRLFLDDLLRKSSCNAWLRNKCRNPSSLEVADVLKCITESPEFDILTNVGLGSKSN